MFETGFLWQGRVTVFLGVFCSRGRPANTVSVYDAVSQETVPLAQVGRISAWKRSVWVLSSSVGGVPISFAVGFSSSFNYVFLTLFYW